MDLSLEEWRPVAGYEGLYEVSNLGRVRSLDREWWNGRVMCKRMGCLLRPALARYAHVQLQKSGQRTTFYVHALVANAFLPACPGVRGRKANSYHIDHINRDGLDNRASNLRWLTLRDNVVAENPGHICHTGGRLPRSRLTEEQVIAIRESNMPAKDIALKFGVSRSYIYQIRNYRI